MPRGTGDRDFVWARAVRVSQIVVVIAWSAVVGGCLRKVNERRDPGSAHAAISLEDHLSLRHVRDAPPPQAARVDGEVPHAATAEVPVRGWTAR
mgnify:FL=1